MEKTFTLDPITKRRLENFFGAAAWDDLDFDDSQKSMDNFFMESARVLKKGGSIFVTKELIILICALGWAGALISYDYLFWYYD